METTNPQDAHDLPATLAAVNAAAADAAEELATLSLILAVRVEEGRVASVAESREG